MSKQTAEEATSNEVKTRTQIVTCTKLISVHQDSCWSWVVCFAGVVSNVIRCGFIYSFGILFPALLDEFQQGKAKTAWVGSIAMVGMGLFGPLIGRLYHRFGARIVTFFGSIISVASLIATSKASNLYVMYVTYGVLFSFGTGTILIITYIEVPKYFMKWRSLSLGLIAMGPGGGLFIMSPIVHALLEKYGWRGTFLAMAGIVSITGILAFIYRPIVLESDREQQDINRKQDEKFWDISILKHKVFLLCTMAGTVFYLSHYTPSVHMVRYLEEIGFAEKEASRLYIYGGLASLLIRPLIGRLNDVSWINMLYIYSIAAAIEGVVTILLPLATKNVHFILYFVVYGLCDGTLGCGLTIAVLHSLPDTLKPLGFSIYNSLSSITSACGPALGGLIADITGSYVPVFHMAGVIMMVSAATLFVVSRVKKPDTLSTKEDEIVWELLVVVEKCSVV